MRYLALFGLCALSLGAFAFVLLEEPTVTSTTAAAAARGPVMIGAGDIADCKATATDDTATGDLVDAQVSSKPNTYVFTLGDNAYPDGKPSDFERCYDPTWGAAGGDFLRRTHPSLGNHEYEDAATSSADGYFDYFVGEAARTGDRGEGYYAYDVGPKWRAIALNSIPPNSSDLAPGCGNNASGRAQMDFLREELSVARSNSKNVVAYWHHARFSDGPHGSTANCAKKFFDLLYRNKADVVLVGHNHTYERLTDVNEVGDPVADGIDEFVVGQGGHDHDPFVLDPGETPAPPGSVDARNNTRSGVLKLTLRANAYDWEYVGVPGESTFTDSGSEPVFR